MNIALSDALCLYVTQRLIRKNQQDPQDQQVQRLRRLVDDGLASGTAEADRPGDWAELDAIANRNRP